MGVEDIKARNEALRAQGRLPGATRRGAERVAARPPVPLPVCGREGAIIAHCHSCGSENRHVRDCEIHGQCTRIEAGKDVDMVCDRCPDHTRRVAARPPAEAANTQTVGVVIGSYGWPELVDLQIRVIRDACGPVPILVSSDKPDAHTALSAICAAHPDCTLDSNAKRIGHTGGDVAAFHKGIKWGAERGLSVVAKLSQRFMITRPRWLQDGAADLLASGLPLASQKCRGREVFDLRTEAALLDVRECSTAAVLDRIKPRRYWSDTPKGMSAERVIFRVLQDLLGGIYWPWPLYTEDRFHPAPGTVWHTSHDRAAYDQLAAKFGVTLPVDFHTAGWQGELAKGEYLYG